MRKPATTRKTVRGDRKPPKDVKHILNDRNYDRLQRLGVRGWFDELCRLYELSVDHNLNLHVDDPKIKMRTIAGKTRVFLPGAALAQLVTSAAGDVFVPNHLLPALVININAPGEIVIAQFNKALAQAREQFPVAFSKPGPGAPNDVFAVRTFLSWRSGRIVQFAELLVWNTDRRDSGLASFPEHVLGEWLGLRDRPATSRAKRKLERALASLPALAAQLKYDEDRVRVAGMQAEALRALEPDDLKTADEWAKDM